MDERKTQRVIADLLTKARIRGQSVEVLVYDLSQGGCMIEVSGEPLQVTDDLVVELDGVQWSGRVAWERDGFAGVKFLRDLARAIVIRLGFKPCGVPFNEWQPRDRFGKLLPSLSAASVLTQL